MGFHFHVGLASKGSVEATGNRQLRMCQDIKDEEHQGDHGEANMILYMIYIYIICICSYIDIYIKLYYGMIFQYVPKNWMIFHMFNRIIWRIRSTSPLQQGLGFSSSAPSGKSMNITFFVRRNLKILETPCPSLRGDVRCRAWLDIHGTAERWKT